MTSRDGGRIAIVLVLILSFGFLSIPGPSTGGGARGYASQCAKAPRRRVRGWLRTCPRLELRRFAIFYFAGHRYLIRVRGRLFSGSILRRFFTWYRLGLLFCFRCWRRFWCGRSRSVSRDGLLRFFLLCKCVSRGLTASSRCRSSRLGRGSSGLIRG